MLSTPRLAQVRQVVYSTPLVTVWFWNHTHWRANEANAGRVVDLAKVTLLKVGLDLTMQVVHIIGVHGQVGNLQSWCIAQQA